MKRPALKNQTGFSLIETLLALGMGLTLLAFLKDPLMSALRLGKLTHDKNAWQNMENDLRQSVLDRTLFQLARRESSVLDACLGFDGKLCPRGRQPITFYLKEKQPTTGLLSAPGKTCSGLLCPVKIEATFTGICESNESCDVVASIEVDYRILIEGKIYRQGYMQRINEEKLVSDDNYACSVDELGRSSFAQRILATAIECLPPPRLNRKISGIETGDCSRGRELLVGFQPDGKRRCEAIKWMKP